MCHEQGACVDFCVTSIHAKRRQREREREIREEEGRSRGYLVTCSRKSEDSDAATDIQTGREAARERGAGRPAGHTLGVLPKFKFLTSLLLLPSFTACWRRSAGLTWLPDAFSLAVKLRK
jgi:hypothetical protein